MRPKWFDSLTDFLVEDILATSDEEIRREMIEDGEDPDEVAARQREMFERAIKEKGPSQ